MVRRPDSEFQKAALVAPLANILALKLGYNYHNRNAPPAGFKK